MEKKKRVAVCQKGGIVMRVDYNFVTDEEFQKSLAEWATNINVDVDNIITYTLGDEDEMEEGNAYFCPRCGYYNKYGYEPNISLYYQEDKLTGESKPTGYFKTLDIECEHCDVTFHIQTDKFNEDTKDLNETFTV
jgi:hypothetical protein